MWLALGVCHSSRIIGRGSPPAPLWENLSPTLSQWPKPKDVIRSRVGARNTESAESFGDDRGSQVRRHLNSWPWYTADLTCWGKTESKGYIMQLRFTIAICLITVLGRFADVTVWAQPVDTPTWHWVTIPAAWRGVPRGDLEPVGGYSWYRCAVKVPRSWRGDELTLCVEALDDARASYVNGLNVGATGTFPPRYRSGLGEQGRYRVDADLVQFGEFNTIAIRVFQNDPRPNFQVAPPVLLNQDKRQGIRMAGRWQYRPEDERTWSKATPADFAVAPTTRTKGAGPDRGVFAKIDEIANVERYIALRKSDHDPFPPKEAEKNFEVAEDLEFQLVLSEPDIAQPLFMTWDERGRLWLMEYLQYPNPAGLKMVSRDVYLRTVYDKVPPPPPTISRAVIESAFMKTPMATESMTSIRSLSTD